MKLGDLQRNWNELGRLDPLTSILARLPKGSTEWDVEDFFATGRREVDDVMDHVESLGVDIARGRALDFGCGVGRLTQALARHFDEVWGVDIAPSMIELAREYNQVGETCGYLVNANPDLASFADHTFQFVYSSITLQHMEPRYARAYIKEFLRTLVPGGVLVFHQPDLQPRSVKGLLIRIIPLGLLNVYRGARYRLSYPARPVSEMHWMKRADVVELVAKNGGIVLDVQEGEATGAGWLSLRYYARRTGR